MSQAKKMGNDNQSRKDWANCRIGITGASGSLGLALTKRLRAKGAFVIGLTHKPTTSAKSLPDQPNEWIQWNCGCEDNLDVTLEGLDILIINHGINHKGVQSSKALNEALEVNTLSSWRLIQRFEDIVANTKEQSRLREIWINTSEAEIQPALSPAYEISKRLLGQLVSIRWSNLPDVERNSLTIRKLILGPFRSDLNPLGIMSAGFVAGQVIKQVELNLSLIIVSPNPITYILMPIIEILRAIYYRLVRNY